MPNLSKDRSNIVMRNIIDQDFSKSYLALALILSISSKQLNACLETLLQLIMKSKLILGRNLWEYFIIDFDKKEVHPNIVMFMYMLIKWAEAQEYYVEP